MLLSPEAFDAAPWNRVALAAVTADAAADPLGMTLAEKIVPDSTTGQHYVYQSHARGNVQRQQTFSVYLKSAGNTTATIFLSDFAGYLQLFANLANGTVGLANVLVAEAGMTFDGSGIEPGGNGWNRAWLTGTLPASTAATVCYVFPYSASSRAGDGVNGVYAFGAALTDGPSPQSYLAPRHSRTRHRFGFGMGF